MIKILFVILISQCFYLGAYAQSAPVQDARINDAYSKIQIKTLPNGLTYVLSPSPKANKTIIRVTVNTGSFNDEKGKEGTAHLLEHFLFRGKKLKSDTSYLDLIQEKGGQGNGQTTVDETSYWGSVPAPDSEWLLQNFSEMLLNHGEFDQKELPKIKNSVLLEIGKPGFFDQLKGIEWLRKGVLEPFKRPTFYESEFGVNTDGSETWEQRLATPNLTTSDVFQYYKKHYSPSNMILYVAGQLPHNVDALVQSFYGGGELSSPQSFPALKPTPQNRPYYNSFVTSETPYIDLGVKVWDLNTQDYVALEIYGDYLTTKLMKELRNKLGQTYTANWHLELFDGFGTMEIRFETNPEDFKKNYQYLNSLLFTKTDHLSQEDFEKTVLERTKRLQSSDSDASTALALARELINLREFHNDKRTPYEVLKSLDLKEENSILQKRLDPTLKYFSLVEPPIFWRYEQFFVYTFSIFFFILLFRGLLTTPFMHDKVRWIRKVKYPAPGFLELILGVLGLYSGNIITQLLSYLAYKSLVFRSTFIFSTYLSEFVEWGVIIGFLTFIFSRTPKKLMLVNNELYVKCISYRSQKIPISNILKVESKRVFSLSFRDLIQMKWRFYFFEPLFLRKGLFIVLKDRRAFFFSMKASESACNELLAFLPLPEESIFSKKLIGKEKAG